MGQPKSQQKNEKINASSAKPGLQYDPVVAQLFDTSLGPTESRLPKSPVRYTQLYTDAIDICSVLPLSCSDNTASTSEALPGIKTTGPEDTTAAYISRNGRKRKRSEAVDDIEGSYLRQLAREDARAAQQALTTSSVESASAQVSQSEAKTTFSSYRGETADKAENLSDDSPSDGRVKIPFESKIQDVAERIPQHESTTSEMDFGLEKASRTVFLANVSTNVVKSKAAKKTLVDHLISFGLPGREPGVRPAIESIRFRSTPFSDGRLPKKAAYIKKELMDSTSKSTNAYAVYATQTCAREAVKKLNGTMFLDRHLRVDNVAHPAKQDHRRCVFVGNLGFVDDESAIKQAKDGESKKRCKKATEAADYEEGLWRTFEQAGKVESVRVVRDKTTRVGKGFAYVQFANANVVEKALLYNGKQFPPMLPRRIRVVRAKSFQRSIAGDKKNRPVKSQGSDAGTHKSKVPTTIQTSSGRATRLFGRAGAAQLKDRHGGVEDSNPQTHSSFVFEGHRASQANAKKDRLAKTPRKPRSRSSRRAAEFKRQRKKN